MLPSAKRFDGLIHEPDQHDVVQTPIHEPVLRRHQRRRVCDWASRQAPHHDRSPAREVIGLIQRVERARVMIDEQSCATISRGILVLVGFVRDDCRDHLPRFIERLLNYRLFGDQRGRMNLSLRDVDGELLLVPQFTLAADTHSGNRPSFTPAASPDRGEALFDDMKNGTLSLAMTAPEAARSSTVKVCGPR
ncbi:MAG: D-tyrosyl-tRNA(Tyr) deacylase [Xanthomonadaceae bacterium]|nr:D-tyrosyl-tRNA(Tyr) deacylase [Xanthomonadaceae bacterium]